MSGMERDELLLRALAERARARADFVAEGRAEAVDRIALALSEQAEREAPRRPRRRRFAWIAAAALPVAAAAAIALVVHASPGADSGGAVPLYLVAVSGHVETERGANDATFTWLQARADAMQEVLLRPQVRSTTALAAKVLLVRGGALEPLDVAVQISDAGVVRFEVPGAALRGASEVRVVVASPARLAAMRDAVTVVVPVLP